MEPYLQTSLAWLLAREAPNELDASFLALVLSSPRSLASSPARWVSFWLDCLAMSSAIGANANFKRARCRTTATQRCSLSLGRSLRRSPRRADARLLPRASIFLARSPPSSLTPRTCSDGSMSVWNYHAFDILTVKLSQLCAPRSLLDYRRSSSQDT